MGAAILILAAMIFIVDAAFMLGRVADRAAAVVNGVVGGLIAICGLQMGFSAPGNPDAILVAGLALIFAVFYLCLAWAILGGHGFSGLGWYCLGAGLYVLLAADYYFRVSGDARFGVFSLCWALLFFSAFGSLALDRPLSRFIGWLLALESVATLLVPGYMMIAGIW